MQHQESWKFQEPGLLLPCFGGGDLHFLAAFTTIEDEGFLWVVTVVGSRKSSLWVLLLLFSVGVAHLFSSLCLSVIMPLPPPPLRAVTASCYQSLCPPHAAAKGGCVRVSQSGVYFGVVMQCICMDFSCNLYFWCFCTL